MGKRKTSHKIKKISTKSKYKKHKKTTRKRKTIRKKRLKYKRITRLGKKWMKQMEIYMKENSIEE